MLFNICCDLNGKEIPQTGAIYTLIYRTSQVVLVVKNPLANAGDIRDTVSTPGWGRPSPEEEMATRFSILAWESPWTEEPGGL